MLLIITTKILIGCILFETYSADLTESMIEEKDGDGSVIKETIENSLNKFEDYEFLLYKFYKLSKNTIYKTELPKIKRNTNNLSIDYYLKNLKDFKVFLSEFNSGNLILFDARLIKNSLLKELNEFNFKDLPTKLINSTRFSDMKQCTKNKLCCP